MAKVEDNTETVSISTAAIFMWEVEFIIKTGAAGESGQSISHVLAFTAEEAVITSQDALVAVEKSNGAEEVSLFLRGVTCIEQISAISLNVLKGITQSIDVRKAIDDPTDSPNFN